MTYVHKISMLIVVDIINIKDYSQLTVILEDQKSSLKEGKLVSCIRMFHFYVSNSLLHKWWMKGIESRTKNICFRIR